MAHRVKKFYKKFWIGLLKLSNKYIKSPLNYTGGKYKLLPQILPLFPKDIVTFVDAFGGGGNVFVNVDAAFYIYNEFDEGPFSIIDWIMVKGTETALSEVDEVINKYGLSKTNKEGYLALREDYNKGGLGAAALYALVCHSFNNQIRFNSKGQYNMPFGKDRSSFNPSLRKKFIEFSDKIEELDIRLSLRYSDYRNVPVDVDSFVYCDPPYLISTATYNENGGWDRVAEKELLEYLFGLDVKGIKFALSNVTHHGGRENDLLIHFADFFDEHVLNISYSNASYQKKDKSSLTREVLITNY